MPPSLLDMPLPYLSNRRAFRHRRLFYLLCCFVMTSAAQADTIGKIKGKVIDRDSGLPIAGVRVIIDGTSFASVGDAAGEFFVLSIPAGMYSLTAHGPDYQPTKLRDVEVFAGLTSDLQVALSPEVIDLGPAQVLDESRLARLRTASAGTIHVVKGDDFDALPLRGIINAYALQPGVVAQEYRGINALHFRGGRQDETGYYLEDVSSRNLITGESLITTIPEALEEFQVQPGGYTAEYGGASSGLVRHVLRSGGEDFHFLLQAESDRFTSPHGNVLDTYSYGYANYVASCSGPLLGFRRGKFFLAGENQFYRDSRRVFWDGFEFSNLVDNGLYDGKAGEVIEVLRLQPGNVPQSSENRYTGNGTLTFDFHPVQIRFAGAATWQRNQLNNAPVLNLLNEQRVPLLDQSHGLANLKLTHQLSAKTLFHLDLHYFDQRRKMYDPLFGDNMLLYSDSLAAAQYGITYANRITPPRPYNFYGFTFNRPGATQTGYQKQRLHAIGGSLDFTALLGGHELKIGGTYDRYAVRSYTSDDYRLVLSYLLLRPDSTGSSNAFLNMLAQRNARVNAYGYDGLGNQLDSGEYGPRHPTFWSAYLQDKLERGKVVFNAGLRFDYFDTDDRAFVDPRNPAVIEGVTYGLVPAQMKKPPAYTTFSPRLGVALQLSERSVLFGHYGQYVQMPRLDLIYAGPGALARSLSGVYFITDPAGLNPLGPVRSRQYEIGISHQPVESLAFEVTAFYKDTHDQVQIGFVVPDLSSIALPYLIYQNGDVATAKGMEVKITLRRTRRLQAWLNYTLSKATGLGSTPRSSLGFIATGNERPLFEASLDFNQTHRGALDLDYRFENGEGGKLLSGFGVNLLFSFNSGHNFTLYDGFTEYLGAEFGGILSDNDPRYRSLASELNSEKTPWNYTLDLRIDKAVRVGKFSTNFYVYVLNLLNTKNVINVYDRTGEATDDGFITDPAVAATIAKNGLTRYAEMYRAINLEHRQHYWRSQGGDLYGMPRQIRFGVRLEY